MLLRDAGLGSRIYKTASALKFFSPRAPLPVPVAPVPEGESDDPPKQTQQNRNKTQPCKYLLGLFSIATPPFLRPLVLSFQ